MKVIIAFVLLFTLQAHAGPFLTGSWKINELFCATEGEGRHVTNRRQPPGEAQFLRDGTYEVSMQLEDTTIKITGTYDQNGTVFTTETSNITVNGKSLGEKAQFKSFGLYLNEHFITMNSKTTATTDDICPVGQQIILRLTQNCNGPCRSSIF